MEGRCTCAAVRLPARQSAAIHALLSLPLVPAPNRLRLCGERDDPKPTAYNSSPASLLRRYPGWEDLVQLDPNGFGYGQCRCLAVFFLFDPPPLPRW